MVMPRITGAEIHLPFRVAGRYVRCAEIGGTVGRLLDIHLRHAGGMIEMGTENRDTRLCILHTDAICPHIRYGAVSVHVGRPTFEYPAFEDW